jgi:hypothetical protein
MSTVLVEGSFQRRIYDHSISNKKYESKSIFDTSLVCAHSYSLYLECCLAVVNCFQDSVETSSKILFENVL